MVLLVGCGLSALAVLLRHVVNVTIQLGTKNV